MKTKILALSCLLAASGLYASEVVVTFENPEDFRDIDYGVNGNERGQKIHLPDLEKYIVQQGKKILEEGELLSITFTDIDLAGEYEPWRPPPADDIRIVKSIYIPRMVFRYELKNAAGEVLRSGEEKLVDLGFDFRVRFNTSDLLYYEKEMFRDWLRKFRRERNP